MKINSNIQAMITNNVLARNESALSASSEKLSSGYRINSAKDNPAGMAITNRMNSQILSLNKATQNSKNAKNVIATAEGALSEIQEMIQRMSELAVKASNGTNTTADRDAIQKEVEALKKEIQRVAGETEYNTQSLLNGEKGLRGYTDNPAVEITLYNTSFPTNNPYDITIDKDADGKVTVTGFPANMDVKAEDGVVTVTDKMGGELKFSYDETAAMPITANLNLLGTGGMHIQVGSAQGQEIQIVIPEISLENMGINEMDMSTEESAQKAMEQLKGALSFVSSVRSQLGAYENRLESTISNLDVSTENLTESYSTIKDVDMAEEMVEYTKMQVLVQAGTSMLTQANEQPQQALQLLQ
ncbi:MAG: flagellin FliC3 [Lachnospiraceae bacterium]|nr:flagellin FliC3 [Lachnospiraceae bacterium]